MRALFYFFYHHKKRSAVLAWVWTALILLACLIPGRDIPDVSVPMADKWTHFLLFGAFSFLWLCALRKTNALRGLAIFLGSAALGYAVELLQGSGITYGRSYDLYDALADTLGGLLGVLLFFLCRRLYAATT